MEGMVRRIVARYMDDPTVELPSNLHQDWMSYLKEKARGDGKPSRAVLKMYEDLAKGENPDHTTELTKPFEIYNPYEYEDPSTKPKDVKDSPPFYNRYPYSPDYDNGQFNKPSIFKGPYGVLKDWYRAREQDWTTDPDQQQPAISIDRKIAASVVDRYLTSVDASEYRSKTAASLKEILNMDYHYKNPEKQQRAASCNVSWDNQGNEKQTDTGLFVFKVTSPPEEGKPTQPRYVYMQFLKGNEAGEKNYEQIPVQLSCSCEYFLFYGPQYYAMQSKYLYYPGRRINPYVMVRPKHQKQYVTHTSPHYPKGRRYPGRGLNSRVCKHILAVHTKFIQRFHPARQVEDFPITSPPSTIMNPDVWKRLMKFDFSEDEIKNRLLTGKAPPAFFQRETITPAVIDWFNNSWIPLDDDEKIKMLKEMVESPERVFFILTKEAYLQRKRGRQISRKLVDEGYKILELGVGEPVEEGVEPQQVPKEHMPGVPEDQLKSESGTWISESGGDVEADKYMTEASPEEIEKMSPDSGEPVSPTAPTAPTEPTQPVKPTEEEPKRFTPERVKKIRKTLRPELKREAASVISKFLIK